MVSHNSIREAMVLLGAIIGLIVITYFYLPVVTKLVNSNTDIGIGIKANYTPQYVLNNNTYIDGTKLEYILSYHKKRDTLDKMNIKTRNPHTNACDLDFELSMIHYDKRYLVQVSNEEEYCITEGGY